MLFEKYYVGRRLMKYQYNTAHFGGVWPACRHMTPLHSKLQEAVGTGIKRKQF